MVSTRGEGINFYLCDEVSIEMAGDSICPPFGTTLWVRGLEKGHIYRVPRSKYPHYNIKARLHLK